MTADTEAVARILAHAEDVDLPPDLAGRSAPGKAPDDSGTHDPGPDADDAGRDGLDPPPPPGDGDGIDWGKVEKAAALPLHDTGNGRRFALYHGRDVMFVPRVGWHVWDETRWLKDPDNIAIRARAQTMSDWIARETVFLHPRNERALQARVRDLIEQLVEFEAIPAKDRSKEVNQQIDALKAERREIDAIFAKAQDLIAQRLRHAKQAGNSKTIDNMLQEAGVGLARPLDQLDADPLKVNCLNGTLRFRVQTHGRVRRCEVDFLPHDRADLITKRMAVAYDPDARAPRFVEFLNRIQPDPLMQGYLQRLFGLSMLAVLEQMMVYLYGDGANGKSVLMDLIARILGDYAASAKIESLTGSNRRGGGDATPDLVPMIGARLVRASEPEKGVKWQEGLIKELTGGEPMLIRALHSDFVEARVFFKLIVSGNHKPQFEGQDHGIWRRVKLVPFLEQIPESEQVRKEEMDAMLFAEAPGVLAWMVEGARDYLEAGLREPEAVTEATQALREESDLIGCFLDEACEVTGDTDDRIGSSELVNIFNYWLTARGMGYWRDRRVTTELADHARKWRSRKTGAKFTQVKSGGRMFYDGIRLTAFFRRDWDAAPKDARGRALSVGALPDGSPTSAPDADPDYRDAF